MLENDSALAEPLIDFVQETLVQSNLFDESAAVHFGVALHEAIANAVNHGNLEVSSDLRQEHERIFEDALKARRNQEPYAQRKVHVLVSISPEEGAKMVIRDEGPGFDVMSMADPTQEVNLDRVGGRGLLLIRTFMDQVSHNPSGNEITFLKRATRTQRPVLKQIRNSVDLEVLVGAVG